VEEMPANRKNIRGQWIALGTGLGVSCWAFLSIAHGLFCLHGSFQSQILALDWRVLWVGFLGSCLPLMFTVHGQRGTRMGHGREKTGEAPPRSHKTLRHIRDKLIDDVRKKRVPFVNPVAEALLQAERQRVMMESIGAACHHFSQPLFVLLGTLEMMDSCCDISDQERSEMRKRCLTSAKRLATIIRKLQRLQKYRTVPYVKGSNKILDIGLDSENPPQAA